MKLQARTNNKRQLEVNWDLVNTYLSKWKAGTILDVEIVRRVKRKSSPLRKYYFAEVIAKYAEHLGYDKGEETILLHRQLKIVHFGIQPDKKRIYKDVPLVFHNDSDMPVPIKKKFVDWVIRCAARDGCIVDDPKK